MNSGINVLQLHSTRIDETRSAVESRKLFKNRTLVQDLYILSLSAVV